MISIDMLDNIAFTLTAKHIAGCISGKSIVLICHETIFLINSISAMVITVCWTIGSTAVNIPTIAIRRAEFMPQFMTNGMGDAIFIIKGVAGVKFILFCASNIEHHNGMIIAVYSAVGNFYTASILNFPCMMSGPQNGNSIGVAGVVLLERVPDEPVVFAARVVAGIGTIFVKRAP